MQDSRARRAAWRALGALVPFLAIAAASPAGALHIEVGNVRGHTGRVHVDICTQAQFLKDCPISGDAPARMGTTVVTLAGLRPGRYAAQVFYDENGNGKIDRALFGIPKEGVGFSNDAKIRLSPPRWEDAVFAFDGRETTIRLNLRYFLGRGVRR
ncbi:MAG: DUF2141 domain-containing protein [Sphingomonadaceae bacterium]|nr:DUF2141 domain-containing protein [Sphingomonadaceae bacterium]